jgi:alkanesulfonate monooxygenase SsuD/methylene tetrahydromethanopterin reductase-like flavin-dependent oxidoreductase (luciferase family)
MRVAVVILPDAGWPELRRRFLDAEARGFHVGWTYDHLSWRSLRDGPWLGTVPLLGAVAATTSRLRFGTLVTSPNFRHPALLAKDAMSLDQISAGRFELGVGAGGTGYDAMVVGAPPLSPAERAERFSEFVAALDGLLRNPVASHHGAYFTAEESRTFPGCVQRPRVPFTVAAAGPKALRVAAAHGHRWVTYGPVSGGNNPHEWLSAVARQSARLDAECERMGRNPAAIRRMLLVGLELAWPQQSVAAWDDFCGRLSAMGFTEVALHYPRPADPDLPGPPIGVFDEISSRLAG